MVDSQPMEKETRGTEARVVGTETHEGPSEPVLQTQETPSPSSAFIKEIIDVLRTMIKEHDQQAKKIAMPRRLAYADSDKEALARSLAKGLFDRFSLESFGTSETYRQTRSASKKLKTPLEHQSIRGKQGSEGTFRYLLSGGRTRRMADARLVQNVSPNPSDPQNQLTDEPIILEGVIEGNQIRRILVDGWISSEVMYEHCFKSLNVNIRSRLRRCRAPMPSTPPSPSSPPSPTSLPPPPSSHPTTTIILSTAAAPHHHSTTPSPSPADDISHHHITSSFLSLDG
nr:reverse transcriptase domain-containing protein [Tanacetum cinerariifolium]